MGTVLCNVKFPFTEDTIEEYVNKLVPKVIIMSEKPLLIECLQTILLSDDDTEFNSNKNIFIDHVTKHIQKKNLEFLKSYYKISIHISNDGKNFSNKSLNNFINNDKKKNIFLTRAENIKIDLSNLLKNKYDTEYDKLKINNLS